MSLCTPNALTNVAGVSWDMDYRACHVVSRIRWWNTTILVFKWCRSNIKNVIESRWFYAQLFTLNFGIKMQWRHRLSVRLLFILILLKKVIKPLLKWESCVEFFTTYIKIQPMASAMWYSWAQHGCRASFDVTTLFQSHTILLKSIIMHNYQHNVNLYVKISLNELLLLACRCVLYRGHGSQILRMGVKGWGSKCSPFCNLQFTAFSRLHLYLQIFPIFILMNSHKKWNYIFGVKCNFIKNFSLDPSPIVSLKV